MERTRNALEKYPGLSLVGNAWGGVGIKLPVAPGEIDLVAKPDLLHLTGELSARKAFDHVFMVSALTGDGVDHLRSYLAEAVPPDLFGPIVQQ